MYVENVMVFSRSLISAIWDMIWYFDLTLPLSTLRAADNSDCGITPFSAPDVFTTDDTADGIDSPCEFSARTKNMYDVAGFSSPICNIENVKKQNLKWNAEIRGILDGNRCRKCISY